VLNVLLQPFEYMSIEFEKNREGRYVIAVFVTEDQLTHKTSVVEDTVDPLLYTNGSSQVIDYLVL